MSDNDPLKPLDALSAPLGELIAAVGRGVADAQQALDAAALAALQRIYSDADDATLAALRQIDYRPTFYAIPEVESEMSVAVTIASQTESSTRPGASRLYMAPVLLALQPRLVDQAAAVSSGLAGAGATYSLAPATPAIGLVWAIGAAWGLLGLAVASARLARLRRAARLVPTVDAERLLARARRQLDHAGAIDLAISSEVGVPTLLGWRRPLCALPAAAFTTWPAADLEWLLVHELAHVRRADIAWNWAQSLVEVALYFHPAARWLARQIRHERECCCDAEVLRRPDALAPYVHALTRLAAADRSSIRPALSATGGTLVSRIERIIDPTTPIPACSRGLCIALVLGALAGAVTLAACETEDDAPTARALEVDKPAQFTDENGVVTQVAAGAAWTPAAAPTMTFTDDKGQEIAVPAGADWAPAAGSPGAKVVDDRRPELPIPFVDPPEGSDQDGC